MLCRNEPHPDDAGDVRHSCTKAAGHVETDRAAGRIAVHHDDITGASWYWTREQTPSHPIPEPGAFHGYVE